MLTKFKTLAKDWTKESSKKINKHRSFKAVTMCEQCYSFYYKSSWHFEKPESLESYQDLTVPVRFTQCPTCLQQELATYNDMDNEPSVLVVREA